MQIGRAHLTESESYNVGQQTCACIVGVRVTTLPPAPPVRQKVRLASDGGSAALVDSGAEENFLDSRLASQLGIPTETLDAPLEARALNGLHLAQVRHKTVPVSLVGQIGAASLFSSPPSLFSFSLSLSRCWCDAASGRTDASHNPTLDRNLKIPCPLRLLFPSAYPALLLFIPAPSRTPPHAITTCLSPSSRSSRTACSLTLSLALVVPDPVSRFADSAFCYLF
ncbi:hypothetical protein L3Q82_000666 [Xyrichtys novacula]|uniref:Uncharacterized protein n=1 Tax=Xyrichtys novacula TaxID=13765 RepID=A0AAV1GWX3_XYRNO|nr:hypothetical protein L3Q82_000666 [Xyrichtys novacula]